MIAPILQSKRVRLEPFKDLDDFEYLYKLALAHKYNSLTKAEMEEDVMRYGTMFWNASAEGIKAAVVFLQILPGKGWHVLSAFRDEAIIHTKMKDNHDLTGEAMKVIIEYVLSNLNDKIHIVHDVRNRPLEKLLERLGFKPCAKSETKHGTYIIQEKRRVENGILS